MRPKIKKVDTNKRKKMRKNAQKILERQTAMFLDHPKECCVCSTPFERTKKTVQSWQVVTRDQRVRLTCPTCWTKVEEALETLG